MTREKLIKVIKESTRENFLSFFCTFDFFEETIPPKDSSNWREFVDNLRQVAFDSRTSFVINDIKKVIEFVNIDIEIVFGQVSRVLETPGLYYEVHVKEFIENCSDLSCEVSDRFNLVGKTLTNIATVLCINCYYIHGKDGGKMRYYIDNLKCNDIVNGPKFGENDMEWEDISKA